MTSSPTGAAPRPDRGRAAGPRPGPHAPDSPAVLLSRARLVMWDFDGPLCDLFSGVPAPSVAAELRGFVAGRGLDTSALDDTDDPLDVCSTVHRLFSGTAAGTVNAVRAALDRLEAKAARRALPTPGARELLERLRDMGSRQVIVSNNSRTAVTAYLRSHGMEHYFAEVVGRPADPDKMKPHPHSLEKALTTTRTDAADALMIGDSAADAYAAAKVGALFVGYCTRPERRAVLLDAGAEHLTDDLAALATAVGGVTGKGAGPDFRPSGGMAPSLL